MADRDKFTNEMVVDAVEREGLGYAIQYYLSSESIEDKVLASLWEEAKRLLDEVSNFLEPYRAEEW